MNTLGTQQRIEQSGGKFLANPSWIDGANNNKLHKLPWDMNYENENVPLKNHTQLLFVNIHIRLDWSSVYRYRPEETTGVETWLPAGY